MTLPHNAPHDVTDLQSRVSGAVRARWKAFLVEGILLALLGLAAIIIPPLASLAVTIFLGWMFLVSGIAGLALTFWARQMPGFWWSLISAVLAIGAGIILLARPVQGTLTLTIVVGAYFVMGYGFLDTLKTPSIEAAPLPKASPPSCTRWSIGANCPGDGRGCWSPA
jgi:Short repeat of unknown function (DUF308)